MKPIETQIVGHIGKCRTEAEKKFPDKQKFVDMVQMFQACVCFQSIQIQ